MDFSKVIEAAIKEKGFSKQDIEKYDKKTNKDYLVGFGHETVLSVAQVVLDAIKSGDISRFYVIGGCDGFEGERSYYTDFALNLPKTSVILTLGCGKYRLNHLKYDNIGSTGIPRLLDLGQCNDAYSAIQIALALKSAVNVESVNDLPLSIILSWFEQKAVAVLLTLLSLGIKNIHVGPNAPGFITPKVLGFLVENYNLKLTNDAKEDIKNILNQRI